MDDPFEYPDVNPENSDITDLNPKGEPQYFFLARLIRYEDDAGGTFVEQNDANQYLPLGRDRPAFDLDDPNFNVAFGDLLLYVNRADQREFQCMRNYAGQAKLVPRRMLMPLHFPFSMGGFPLRTKGVPIDIAFAKTAISVGTNGSHDWDDMTAFLVQRKYDEEDNENNIIDLWDKRWSGMPDSLIYRPEPIPWGVLVSRVDIEAYTEESERKSLNHIMNLPRWPRTQYRTDITVPKKGYPHHPYIFRERFINNNPKIPLWPKEVIRTGQREVDYKNIYDATGIKPRERGPGCGALAVQVLDPQSPAEIDRNKAAKKIKKEKKAAALAQKFGARPGTKTGNNTKTKTNGKKCPTCGRSDSPDPNNSSSDDSDSDSDSDDVMADEVYEMSDDEDEPMVEHKKKWVPPLVDNDHFWPPSDAYDDMGSEDECPWPIPAPTSDDIPPAAGPIVPIITPDTPTDYAY